MRVHRDSATGGRHGMFCGVQQGSWGALPSRQSPAPPPIGRAGDAGGGGEAWPAVPSAPRVTFRRVFLYGALDSHPFTPSHVASGRCVLSAAAAGVLAGAVPAFAEPSCWCAGAVLNVAGCAVCASAAPSSWRIGDCAGCCRGRLTVFVDHTPPSSGRPQPASLCFRVHEAQVPCSSTRCPGRPPHTLPHSVGRTCAWRVPCWLRVACTSCLTRVVCAPALCPG